LAGIKSVEQVRKEAQLIGPSGPHLAGVLGNLAGQNDHLAPPNGHLAPTSQVATCEVENPVLTNGNGRFMKPAGNLAPFLGEHILEKPINGRK